MRPAPASTRAATSWPPGSETACAAASACRAVPRAELAAGFARILAANGGSAPDGVGEEPGFTDASYRGSGDDRFRAWLTEPGNTDVHERLSRALFCVSVPAPGDASMAGVTDEAGRLRAGAFATGHYWTYKPLTYELAADDSGWAALLVEHSTVDGATLVQTVADIQAGLAGADAGDRADALAATDTDGAGTAAGEGRDVGNRAPQELTWTRDLAAPEHALPDLEIRRVARPRPKNMKLSADAYAQLVMTVAQLAAYGRVRAVYEAVDMREYAAGRTECLRLVTPAAVTFARTLPAGSADRAGLQAALDAHRDWVKACKTGRGVDRHLWALGWTAQELGEDPEFLRDPRLAAAHRLPVDDLRRLGRAGGALRLRADHARRLRDLLHAAGGRGRVHGHLQRGHRAPGGVPRRAGRDGRTARGVHHRARRGLTRPRGAFPAPDGCSAGYV